MRGKVPLFRKIRISCRFGLVPTPPEHGTMAIGCSHGLDCGIGAKHAGAIFAFVEL